MERRYFQELLDGGRTGWRDRLMLLGLRFCAIPYAALLRWRAAAYAAGLLRTRRLDRPVISVGNLTVGGTGKTPTVALIARLLMARGKRVVVLSRGYGGSREGESAIVSDGERLFLSAAEAGDEPVLLARSVPGLAVVIGADRYRAGRLAQEQLAPDLFLLDDGFQHLRLHRDLNILLLDGERPLDNGLTLPAGWLREPPLAVRRADLVIYTRCRGMTPMVHGHRPYCRSSHRLTGVRRLTGGELLPFAHLAGERVLAFAGIANPAAFFAGLAEQGVEPVACLPLPDHCPYTPAETGQLAALARQQAATCLLTTGKDGVKLTGWGDAPAPLYTTELELHLEDERPLLAALAKLG